MSGAANWWEAAPLAQPLSQTAPPPPAGGGNWWDAAPLADGGAPPPAAARPTAAGAFARGLARGVTMGAADEMAAGVLAAGGAAAGGDFGQTYTRALDAARGMNRRDDAERPVSAMAGQIAGGAIVPLGPIARFAAGGMSLPGAAVRGVVAGAGLGGVAGFNEGEGGAGNRVAAGATGAALGGAVGGALAPAFAAGGVAANAAGRLFGATPPPDAAAQRLALRSLGRDGTTVADVRAASQAAGAAPVALPDLAGPNTLRTAEVVARIPGRGPAMAARMVEGRGGASQAGRLRGEVNRALGGGDFREEVDALLQQRAAEAAPLYARAYAVELPRDLRLQRFLNDPDVRAGVREGMESARREALSRDEAFDPAAFGVRFADDGDMQLVGGGIPTRLFDAAKRGLDRLEEGARGPNGEATSKSREVANLRRAMLAEVDRLNPDFAEARAAYAGPTLLVDAMRLGRRMVGEGPEAADMSAREIAKLSPSEREFFRQGVGRALLDRIEGAGDREELRRMRQVFGTPAVRDRLRAAFDGQDEFDAFARAMDREMSMAVTNRAANPRAGSATMPLQEARLDLASPPRGPAAGAVTAPREGPAGGAPVSLLRDLAQAGTGGGFTAPAFRLAERAMDAGAERAVVRNASALAPYLFETDPAARAVLLGALARRQADDARLQGLLAPAARGLLGAGAVGGGLLAN